MKPIAIALLVLLSAASSMADPLTPPAVGGEAAAGSSEAYTMPPAQLASAFARIRWDEVADVAREERLTIPEEMTRFFACAEKNDWEGIKSAMHVLSAMSGGYEGTNAVPGVAQTTCDTIHTFWDDVLDVYGFSEQVHLWDAGLLSFYAKAMLKNIPPGAIIYGGTDPGRFVLTAYLAVENATNRFLITQNGLADTRTYMPYVRRKYAQLHIPSVEVCNDAFTTYGEGVRSGRLPPDPSVSVQDGRIAVRGAQGIMTINGILAQWIFDKNKDSYAFYVEESYVIPWMYPHLSPRGLIMKLNAEPLKDISPEVVKANHAFWDKLTAHLLAREDFKHCREAPKHFSKMRVALGGLYASRRMYPDAEYALRQAITLCPGSTEANYRLADVLMQQRKFAEARTVIESYATVCDVNERVRVQAFLSQLLKYEQGEARRFELESLLGTDALSATNTVELAGIYLNMNLHGEFISLTRGLMASTNLPSTVWRQLADVCTNAPWSSEAADIRRRALERAASAPR